MSDTKQLRLAVVCYGGVSLAVYMHGVTKELLKLVRASRGVTAADDDTEAAYRTALGKLDTPLDVVIDVISGTSAGGINGVFLARALAEGRSVDKLRSLWINDGDLEGLLHGHALVPFPHREHMLSKLADALARLLRPDHHADGPLNGELMSRLLFQALQGMQHVSDPLVPPTGTLDLFTTATDVYGYSTAVPTGVGGLSHTDRSFRQVLGFHYGPTTNDFGTESVPALAFAARATSSFPGAFPAVSTTSFADAVDPDGGIDEQEIWRHFQYCGEYGSQPGRSWYMDGGVLDNGPFDLVIDAIAGKRADGPVARELLYLEPDPGPGPTPDGTPDAPSWLKLVLDAKLTIPGHTSLVAALDQLRAMNTAITDVGAIAESQQQAVTREMTDLQLNATSTYEDMRNEAERIRTVAKTQAGLGYGGYCRLRAEAVADSMAHQLALRVGYPPHSNRHTFVVAVAQAWMRSTEDWANPDPQALDEQLTDVDVPFRTRRAQFVLQGVNELLDRETDADVRKGLSQVKSAVWTYLEELAQRVDAATAVLTQHGAPVFGVDVLTDDIALGNPVDYAAANGAQLAQLFNAYKSGLTMSGTSQSLWEEFQVATEALPDETRNSLAARYLMFPIWDAIIFPIIALAKLPQLAPISVTRFSPLDATTLNLTGAPDFTTTKIKGRAIFHFGGFFDKGWRENDYLWGRLDGAELIMRLLAKHGGEVDLSAELGRAFDAILTAEAPELGDIQGTVAAIRTAVTAMPEG